ncbi:type I polyketide synthase [Saccharothrix sp. NRRL B-16314]|uniref:type I polyketide synthase n=1 Tax=Saccharothrix sp. NRRL B-16314 TaxID=1463825 RepID=UPI00068C21D3|nr:type I polyketide synthase [Saccharothrix sp. NRRL B-16314]
MSDHDDSTDFGPDAVPGTDIAIVGMSGRFPGAADVAGLWRTIRGGASGITRFTDEELKAAGVPAELLDDPGYVKAGGVLDGIELFDAGFFGVTPKEAQILDPQHRLFMEHSWEALEDAAVDPTRFDGAIGVIAGSAWSSYLQNNLSPSGVAASMGEMAVGLANDKDSLTTRVAHTLGLTGPSYAVQSYCSTSLVAVAAAAGVLANFEADVMLAGGVNIAVPHRVGYLYQQGGIAPPDAETRAFDAAGLGSPLSSGVGVVALRRLSDALADGDRIYAVIRGWAVNNDGGRKVGFTAPGVRGQAAVIAEALASAGLDPADIDYVEAHGTGTALGDAAELAAMQQVFRGGSLRIGSVKTNVGHLDRAAGVTNLIKAALALRNEEIPPTRNLTEPNRQLGAGDARLEVVTDLTPWPREAERVRRAGVSAFGIGGTNAHVVIEEAPLVERPEAAPRPELLVWSARSDAAADAMTTRLADRLETGDDRLSDVAHTLQTGRQAFEHRRVLVAGTAADAITGLRDGRALGGKGTAEREVALLFAGTGEQYRGMATDLCETEPVFCAALEECRAVLTRHMGVDPLEDMLGVRGADGGLGALLGRADAASAESTDRLQPAVFAVEYALARLFEAWGVRPKLLAGYSVGEYVAACLAGVLSLDDALALVAHRAQLINDLPAGEMAAIPLSADEVRARLERAAVTTVDVAAVNGPELTVVAGEPDGMRAFRDFLADESVPSRPLATTHAFHSRMLEPIRAELTAWVALNVTLNAPEVPYVSNVTGELATAEQVTDPAYWAEHMCAPVRFDAVLATVLAQGDLALLEIGPGPSLGTMARAHRDCPPDRWAHVVAALPASADPRPGSQVVAEAVGRLWLAGVDVDWAGYQRDRPVAKVSLPTYPFERQRYWIDPPATQAVISAVAPTGLALDADVEHVQLMSQTWTARELSGSATPERCVLLADTTGVADALADVLRGDGTDVLVLRDGHSLAEADQVATTLVDLRLLDHPESDVDGRGVVRPIAAMLDAWGTQGGNARVVLVTRGGQAVLDGESPLPAHAAAAGLPVVANQEYLNLECRTVDLDVRADAGTSALALAAEVRQPADDVLAAYRDGRRHVRGYAPAEPSDSGFAVRRGGTYLITGGLGDVGLVLAEHLATAGATRLVLTSRSGIPAGTGDRRSDGVARLRALGVDVLTPAVDVTDVDAMRALVADVLADGPLDGVVHAAAVTGPETFRALRDVDDEAVDRHFGAKVAGANVLARVFGELPPERAPAFCVVFSSTSSILGGITFGSYAAANAALTALAHRNERWIAASWDTWAMTLERIQGGVGAAMVKHSMSTAEGLAAFDRLLADGRPATVVAAGGLADRLPRAASMLDMPVGGGERFARPDLPQPYAPPLTATERTLAELWSDVLGVEPVGIRDAFFDLGGNSLVALQMLALVKKRFGVAVPAVTLFEAPTVGTLAAVLDQQGASAPAPRPVVTRPREESGDDRRIAVVGMAGRFPGAPDVRAFWDNIKNGVETISFFTEEELRASGVTPEEIADPSYVRARPVLDNVGDFDAAFFGMNPRMAAITDPQQRMFLEVCWEALEEAGYAVPGARGRVGVYGGSNISTYLLRNPEQLSNGEFSIYEVIMGNDKDALTTTVSYLLDLYGPSVAVQTFCSTSLVATHLAIQALRNGECEMALAGGVSIRVPDKIGHEYMPGGMESPDGHVRTFDAQAAGSMFGDGAAVVVLKRRRDHR